MKKLFFILLAISFNQVSFAHKEWVHKYVTIQAYEFLKLYHPLIISTDFNSRIGDYNSGCSGRPWNLGSITAGSYREDCEDVMYHNAGIIGQRISITHFWDADAGDNSQIQLCDPECWSYDNAYQKALNYVNGSKALWVFMNLCHPPNLAAQAGTMYLKYNSLIDLYQNKKLYIVRFTSNVGQTTYYNPPILLTDNHLSGSIYNNVESLSKTMVWEILGRISHLLADMSVPAHVKNDDHACQLNDPDGYELYMGGNSWNVLYCNDPQTTFPAQNWTALTAQTQGGLIDISGMNINEVIRYLFYTQNQLADFFPSEDDVGDNYLPNGTNSYIQSRYQILGTPPTNVNNQAIANETFNFCIRAIATLFYWFAIETEMLSQIIVKNDFNAGSVKVNGVTYPSRATFSYLKGSTISSLQAFTQYHNNYWWVPDFWQKIKKDGTVINHTDSIWNNITVDGHATFNAKFNRWFNISISQPYYIEPGSGGYYKINGSSIGTQWSTTFLENKSSPITLEAVPPSGYIFVGWSDGETANPRILSPIDHISELYSIYKIPMKSNVLSAVSGNTQRKLVKATDLFLTYESAGRIFLTRSTNGANT